MSSLPVPGESARVVPVKEVRFRSKRAHVRNSRSARVPPFFTPIMSACGSLRVELSSSPTLNAVLLSLSSSHPIGELSQQHPSRRYRTATHATLKENMTASFCKSLRRSRGALLKVAIPLCARPFSLGLYSRDFDGMNLTNDSNARVR